MIIQRISGVALLVVVSVTPALADLPQTRIGSFFPPAGQSGATNDVSFSGEQDLEIESVPGIFASHPGITGEPDRDPATGLWRNGLVRITVAWDVPPGRYDLRLGGYYGVSNPRSFRVEAVPIAVESSDPTPAAPAALPVNTAFYGKIGAAADVDVFTFKGEAGQTVLFRCDAEELESPLQPVLELTAPDGRRVGFAGGVFSGSAVLPYVLPVAGEYRLQLVDASYRGGDYQYRLEAATRPVVVSVWPPSGVPGTTAEFALLGYNIPGGEPVVEGQPLVRRTVSIELPADIASTPTATLVPSRQAGADGFDYHFRDGNVVADPVTIYLSGQTPVDEQENDSPPGQPITNPAEIAARFEKRGDVDHYLLTAKPGEVAQIAVYARRFGSSADPVLTIDQVTGPDGKPKERRLAASDDTGENIAPDLFNTATDDPVLRFDPPEAGTYRITLSDRYGSSRGDDSLFYQLSIRSPRPDFRLVAVPVWREKADAAQVAGGVSLRKGESVSLPVYAIRTDGFTGPIRVTATELPAGLTTTGVTIAEGQSSATLVLTAANDAATWQGAIKVVGEADLPESPGRPAQTARYDARIGVVLRHGATVLSRLTTRLVASILDEPVPYRISSSGGVVRVGQGSQILLPLESHRREGFAEAIAVAAGGLPNDSKVAVEVKPFDPALAQQLARLVVDKQAPARTYVVVFSGNAKIDYGRFPLRLARAKAAQNAATTAFTAADAAFQKATVARDQAKQVLASAEAVANSAADPVKQPAVMAVESAKTVVAQLEAALKAAEELRKPAEAAKANADKAAGEAEKVSAVAKVDYSTLAPTFAVTIVPSPVDLTAEVPNSGQIKRGETIQVKLTAKRQNNFAGPVTLALALAPGSTGLTAEPVTLAADQTEATVAITAAADAAEGDLLFPAIRATAEQNGPVQIDLPVGLKVIP